MYESLLPLLLLINEGESVRTGRALSPVPDPLTNEREGEGEGEGEAAHTVLSSISDMTEDGPQMRGVSDSSFENVRVIRTCVRCSDPLKGCWKTCCVCCVCCACVCCIDDEEEEGEDGDGLLPLHLLSALQLFLFLLLLDAVLLYGLLLSS